MRSKSQSLMRTAFPSLLSGTNDSISKNARRKVRQLRTRRLVIEALEERAMLANQLDGMTSALNSQLSAAEDGLRDVVNAATATLPVLNKPLGSIEEIAGIPDDLNLPGDQSVPGVIDRIRSTIVNTLGALANAQLTQGDIRTQLFNALTAAGILGDTNTSGGAPTVEDVYVSPIGTDATGTINSITIEVRLTGSINVASQDFAFGLGLPGLPLEIDGKGQLAITAGFDYKNLGFGLNNGSFFLDTSATDELTASVTASVNQPTMRGLIGFLEMEARATTVGNPPTTTLPTALNASLTVDVQSPTPGSIAIVGPRLGGSADINLTLTGSFNNQIKYQVPSIATDFHMHWDLGGADPTIGQPLGAEPIVDFNNVRVSLGQFLSKMVAPIVKDVQTFIEPLTPILEILNHRLTGISDVSEKAGLGPVSLLTLADVAASTGTLPPDTKAAVELAATLVQLATIINDIQTIGGNVYLPVGSFNLNQLNPNLRGLASLTDSGETLRQVIGGLGAGQNLTALASIAQDQFSKLETLVAGFHLPDPDADAFFHSQMNRFTDKVKQQLDQINNGVKLEFPFIENPRAGVFNLLLGRDAEFVTFTTKFDFQNAIREAYDLFKVGTPLGPVQVQGLVMGDVDVDLLFKVGYDTYGLRQFFKSGDSLRLVDGFYIDQRDPVTGVIRPELLKFNGGARVGLNAEVPLPGFGFVNPTPIGPKIIGVSISAEFTGGARITGSVPDKPFFVSLIDPNTDPNDVPGRVRVRELLKQPQLFVTDGQLLGDLKADFVARTPLPVLPDVVLYHLDVASQTLIDLSLPQYKENPFFQKPSDPLVGTPAITDLNFLPRDGSGHDGKPNQVRLTIEKGSDNIDYYRVYFKNGLVDIEGPGSPGWQLLANRPLQNGNEYIRGIMLYGSSDDDHITIETDLLNDVMIDARGGKNSLTVISGTKNYSYRFTNDVIAEQKHTTDIIEYHGIDNVALDARRSTGAAFGIRELRAGVTLTIDGSNVRNGFDIGDTTMNSIQGNLVIHGGSGDDDMKFFDSASTNFTTWIVDEAGVRRLSEWYRPSGLLLKPLVVDVLSFDLTAIEHVTIHGGGKVDSLFSLNSNRGQRYEVHPNSLSSLRIQGGLGDDTYVLGSEAHGLNTPLGRDFNISIQDAGGNDELHVNDRETDGFFGPSSIFTAYAYTVNSQSVKRDAYDISLGPTGLPQQAVYRFEVRYTGLENVSLYGGQVSAGYSLDGFKGSTLTVVPGAANDHVTLGTQQDGFSKFTGTALPSGQRLPVGVLIKDVGGVDDLEVNSRTVYLDDGYLADFVRLNAGYSGFETLRVYTPTGNTNVDVGGLSADITATITGAARVKLGTGTLSNIKGSVSIATQRAVPALGLVGRGNPSTALSIDDSADAAPTTFLIDLNSISAAHEGVGQYLSADFGAAYLSSLSLSAGPGGNVITLADTRGGSVTGPITLNAGLGADTVNVQRTNTAVTVNGQEGTDIVSIGAAGSVQGIRGMVTMTNLGDWSKLNVDDSADTSPRTVIMNLTSGYGTITGLAPAVIRYRKQDVRAVNVTGGSGNNVFDIRDVVQSTIPGGSMTTVKTGSGDDIVGVFGTTGALTVDGEAGWNQITIGGRRGQAGKLDRIQGQVILRGQEDALNDVVITDSASTGKSYTMTATQLLRFDSPFAVNLPPIDFGAVQGFYNLEIYGSKGNNAFQFEGTPNVPGPTGAGIYVYTGPESDSVTLRGTGGPLNLNLGGGTYQSVLIGNATTSLDAIRGAVSVTGQGFIDAYISDEASTTPKLASIDHNVANGQIVERHDFVLVDGAYAKLNTFKFDFPDQGRLNYQAGRSGPAGYYNSVGVYGVPANTQIVVRGGPDYDLFTVGFAADASRILGPVTIFSPQADIDLAYFYDYLNPNPQTYTVRTNPSDNSGVLVERPGMPTITYNGLTQLVYYSPLVGGNTINIQSVPASLFLNMINFERDKVTVGSNAPGLGGTLADVRGTMAFTGSGAVDVILDDSAATTAKHVTLTPRSGVNSYGNLIQGLTGAGVHWRLDDRSSISILGGAADDTFSIASSSLPAAIRIDGGGGVNTLDYSTQTGLYGQVNWYTAEGASFDGYVTDDVSGELGVLRNGATLDSGKVGQAFSLDGVDDFIEIPDYPNQTPSSISIDAWVNPNTVAGDQVILSKYQSSDPGPDNVSWVLMNIDGRIRFGIYQGSAGRVIDTDATVLTAGVWQHVAGTFDVATQTMTIYVDGVAIASSFVAGFDAAVTAIGDSKSPVRIGAYVGASGGPSGFWNGSIDEVDVFHRALTAAEVQSIVASGSAGKSAIAGSIYVNLQTGIATGLAGGIANIQNAIGGAGNDILVGNGGNVLKGGAGRDLLIAGATASILGGGADEDVLIGGAIIDSHPENLDAIMAEWSKIGAGLDYNSRVATLRANLLVDGKISSNGGNNTLTGGDDALDFFFGSFVTDWQEGEDAVLV